jgi:hypothetical protein
MIFQPARPNPRNRQSAFHACNVIDDVDFFVRQHYIDFLIANLILQASHSGRIKFCRAADNAACVEVKRINVSAAFYLSIEFQETG